MTFVRSRTRSCETAALLMTDPLARSVKRLAQESSRSALIPESSESLRNRPRLAATAIGSKTVLGGCNLILSIDRLDYSKGLPERMAAVEMLFERYPKLRGRVTFLQIASPSREDVFQYQIIRQELEGAVGRINGRFASSEWTPVRYVSETYSQSRLCGLFQLSRVGLTTPLRDGMNLVAKSMSPRRHRTILVCSYCHDSRVPRIR